MYWGDEGAPPSSCGGHCPQKVGEERLLGEEDRTWWPSRFCQAPNLCPPSLQRSCLGGAQGETSSVWAGHLVVRTCAGLPEPRRYPPQAAGSVGWTPRTVLGAGRHCGHRAGSPCHWGPLEGRGSQQGLRTMPIGFLALWPCGSPGAVSEADSGGLPWARTPGQSHGLRGPREAKLACAELAGE